MTDETRSGSKETSEERQRWIKDLQTALDRTGNAARTAWEATRDNRMSALESAKQAAKELGEVLEKGMDAARERWDTETGAEKEGGQPTGTTGATPPPSEPPPFPGTEHSSPGDTSSPDEPTGG